jgi:hypothetical protein
LSIVRRFKGFGYLLCVYERHFEWIWPTSIAIFELLAFNELEDKDLRAFSLNNIVNCSYISMVQGCKRLRFAVKPGEMVGVVRHAIRQHLNRDIALKPRVAGAVHLSHAAFAEQGGDLIGAQVLTNV